MSAKTASRAKITASLGKSSNEGKKLVQTKMFSPAHKSASLSSKPTPQAYFDLTSIEDLDEIESAIVTSAPPEKKQKLSTVATEPQIPAESNIFPRITNKLTLQELREEALARKIDPFDIPKTKTDLLHRLLLEGSIHLKETREYKQYMQLLETMEKERPQLMQQSAAIREAEENKRLERQRKQQEKRDAKRKAAHEAKEEARQKLEAERNAARAAEIAAQKHLHSHSFPRVHPHMLACTLVLKTNGQPRNKVTCNVCYYPAHELDKTFTCETCDWDICEKCFRSLNRSPEEIQAQREKIRKRREIEEKELARQRQQQELEFELEWNATKRFSAVIIKPSASHKSHTTKGHKYIVWCSDGPDYEEPNQHFDTSWKTASEANDRARYLFFWKNPSGIEPHEVGGDYNGTPEPSFREGLVTYTVDQYHCRWTVGVVPTAVFPHLKCPVFSRHRYDDEDKPEESECDFMSY